MVMPEIMLIDAGNSRVKWATYNAQTGVLGASMAETYASDERTGQYSTVNQLVERENPARIILVHVLGEDFEAAVIAHCQVLMIDCKIVSSRKVCCGVVNGYDNASSLGADRFVGIIAAHCRYPQENVIVIDAGTAVTIDMIDRKGQHLGGVILPGLQLWSDALIKNTQLQHVSFTNKPDVFAKNTKTGIGSGSLVGLAGAVFHICDVMQQKLGQPVKRVFCGGDSGILINYYQSYHLLEITRQPDELVPDLVIDGLKRIAEWEDVR